MSQSLALGILLAVSGGMLDAYTFLCRGGMFATAETGNLVMLGISAAGGDYRRAAFYVLSVAAFTCGIFTAEMMKRLDLTMLHWRQWVLLIECVLVLGVSFMPENWDLAVCLMVSYVSAIQLETFRKFQGRKGATTMCTGNLRSASELVYKKVFQGGEAGAHVYWLLIGAFVVGATISASIAPHFGDRSSLFACIPLGAAFGLMFLKSDVFSDRME